jgi:MoaA/NifB/PqqE/SkfB family radical SAM enzyme
MRTDKILELLDQAQAMGFQGRVGFHHFSEPLLDPRNIMLAEEASKRGMRPYLHTNGDILRRDDDLCGHVKRVYDPIVVGLYDYRTNEELEETKEYWRSRLAGATTLLFSPIGPEGVRSADSIGIPKALVPTDSRMAAPDLTFPNAPCHRPVVRMIIQHDGEMCLCCEDTYGAFTLGNVYKSSLEELWFSEGHIALVEELLKGMRQKHPLCRICPQPPTAPLVVGQKIDMERRHFTGTYQPSADL